ncbi:MAG: cobalt ECF transporter T component CbiQ [Acidimicrobiia bacterium]|nr:cobalt ECF transporter T component CbiQ [Acidimicrobiia bacterium]
MGAGHAHALYVHEHSVVHRIAPEAKIVATLAVVGAVALTPREAFWAFGLFALILATVATLARIGPGFIAVRLLGVVPFLLFAFLIPFVGGGEQTVIAGVKVSIDGLWAMWNIVAKATLGATTSILLAATTEVSEILRGLTVLRVPSVMTAIAAFMIRYLELVVDEFGRMTRAMAARGYVPRWLWQAAPLGAAAGTLFIRTYERGERVHAAMLARGFDGTMPQITARRASPKDWAVTSTVALAAVAVAILAWVLR